MEHDWSKVMKPYPPRRIILPNGDEMVVKSMEKSEIEEVCDALIPNLKIHKEWFDLVTAEMITEFYLWRENRPMWGLPAESHFNLVGRVDGEVVGVTNGALRDPKTGCSLHTTTLKRGLQIGAYLWPCKLEMYFDVLGVDVVEASAESLIGGRKLFQAYGFTAHPDKKSHFGTMLQTMTKQQWDRIKAGKLVGERI
ncbi:MAG: hypothetical protein QW358_01270 [Candidatus Hadarchaeum sp.]